MAASTDFAAMNYQDLLALAKNLNSVLDAKRQEALDSIASQIMAIAATPEELASRLGRGYVFSTVSQDAEETTLALPEVALTCTPEREASVETLESSPVASGDEENKEAPVTESVFDHPALKASYHPDEKKDEAAAAPEEPQSSLEDLLSDDPRYKEYFAPESPVKSTKRDLTMDELLSGEPVNKIMLMGNVLPKGALFRQHTRISHTDGIIPTETATGQTRVYIR